MAEDETIGWHHPLNGHGFRWTLGVGDGQGGLACCGSWGRKYSDKTERLNSNFLLGFSGGSVVKNPPANAGDTGLILDPGRSHMLWNN